MRILRFTLFEVGIFAAFALLNLGHIVFLGEFGFQEEVIFLTRWIDAFLPFVEPLDGDIEGVAKGLIILGLRLSYNLPVGFIIKGDDVGGVYCRLAFLSVKEDFVGVVFGEESNNFTRPIRIVLTFGKYHLMQSKLAHLIFL